MAKICCFVHVAVCGIMIFLGPDIRFWPDELLQKNAEQQYIITNMELSIKKLTEIIGKKEEKISVLTEKNKALQKIYCS